MLSSLIYYQFNNFVIFREGWSNIFTSILGSNSQSWHLYFFSYLSSVVSLPFILFFSLRLISLPATVTPLLFMSVCFLFLLLPLKTVEYLFSLSFYFSFFLWSFHIVKLISSTVFCFTARFICLFTDSRGSFLRPFSHSLVSSLSVSFFFILSSFFFPLLLFRHLPCFILLYFIYIFLRSLSPSHSSFSVILLILFCCI